MIIARTSRLLPRVRQIAIGLSACAAALAGSSVVAQAKPTVDDPIALVCRNTMGVQPGTAQFDACAASLSGSQRSFSGNGAVLSARDVCLNSGLKERTAALAECTLKGSDAAAGQARLADVVTGGPAAGSYFTSTGRERLAREKLACARIGLNPRLGAFDSCVAGLQAAMFASDNPSN
jgi:hypothetical protein